MIKGLRKFLEANKWHDEIKSIIPGEIHRVKHTHPFEFLYQYDTITGVKCIARSGNAVQEVFIVSDDIEGLRDLLWIDPVPR